MKRRRAFTLIELLVVIATIALLLGILMPSLQRARKMAHGLVCRSNVKQWGLISHMYAQDNWSRLPQSIAGGTLTAQQAYWIMETLPYYSNRKIRLCPSTKIVRDQPANRSHGGTLAAWGPFDRTTPDNWWADFDTGSYGINEWCSCPPSATGSYWGVSAGQGMADGRCRRCGPSPVIHGLCVRGRVSARRQHAAWRGAAAI